MYSKTSTKSCFNYQFIRNLIEVIHDESMKVYREWLKLSKKLKQVHWYMLMIEVWSHYHVQNVCKHTYTHVLLIKSPKQPVSITQCLIRIKLNTQRYVLSGNFKSSLQHSRLVSELAYQICTCIGAITPSSLLGSATSWRGWRFSCR